MQWLFRVNTKKKKKKRSKQALEKPVLDITVTNFFRTVCASRCNLFHSLTLYKKAFFFFFCFWQNLFLVSQLCEQLYLHPLHRPKKSPLKEEWKTCSFANGQLSMPRGSKIQDTAGCITALKNLHRLPHHTGLQNTRSSDPLEFLLG